MDAVPSDAISTLVQNAGMSGLPSASVAPAPTGVSTANPVSALPPTGKEEHHHHKSRARHSRKAVQNADEDEKPAPPARRGSVSHSRPTISANAADPDAAAASSHLRRLRQHHRSRSGPDDSMDPTADGVAPENTNASASDPCASLLQPAAADDDNDRQSQRSQRSHHSQYSQHSTHSQRSQRSQPSSFSEAKSQSTAPSDSPGEENRAANTSQQRSRRLRSSGFLFSTPCHISNFVVFSSPLPNFDRKKWQELHSLAKDDASSFTSSGVKQLKFVINVGF